ncbi:MAG: ATP-binding protein [Planctomycetes bacterium]|nr:ATP-binding protein [Planctomycetota bacterium]
MGRFWNLQTKFMAVIVLLLLGSFVAQSVVHHANEERLLSAVTEICEALANEVTERIETREAVERTETMQPQQASVAPETPRSHGRRLQLVHAGGRTYLAFREPSREERAQMERIERMRRERAENLRRELAASPRSMRISEAEADEFLLRLLRHRSFGGPIVEDVDTAFARDPALFGVAGAAAAIPVAAQPFAQPAAPAAAGAAAPQDFSAAAPNDAAGLAARDAASASPGTSPSASGPARDSGEAIDIAPYTQRLRGIFAEYRRYDIMATIGIFLMGIACAWWLGLRITQPVYEVVDGFRRVSDGNLEVKVPQKGSGEFALLGQQFNRMVDRLRENRSMERELEQRERVQLMGDLAAGVAHDVRNPLNAIHLNVGQIRDEFVPEEEGARERFLRFTSDVQREVVRLNRLVTDFLSLARPAGEEFAPVDPNELLRGLARLIAKEASGRKIEVREEFDPKLAELSWNAPQMTSAFLNVAVNGLQAMEPDGGVLTLRSEFRRSDAGSEAAISISDTGCGIPPEHLDKVFLPYFTTRSGGTGLGMAIARRVAERHGGRIAIHSAAGEGTTVVFHFPLPAAEGARA